MQEIIIRDFTMQDIDAYYEMYCSIVNEKMWFSMDEPFSYQSSSTFRQSNIDAGLPMVVACVDDKVVGWCDIFNKNKLGIGIAEGYRDRGIGRNLINAIVERCKSKGCMTITLDVFVANERAIALYSKIGFKKIPFSLTKKVHNGVMKQSIAMKIKL